MSVKIQIASLEALERLIGGDSELEIEIRNSIVQAFTNKHLKAIGTKLIETGLENSVKQILIDSEYLKEKVLNPGYREAKFVVLGDQITALIREKIESIAREEVWNLVHKDIDRNEMLKMFNQKLELSIVKITDTLTDGQLNKRIETLVDQRLKERLNIKS